MNEESFTLELQKTFLNEAQEMLEDTEAAFIQIEADPNDSGKIDKIFRLVHTIKGSAHVAGFTGLGEFAHTFETLLSALREKKITINPDLIDVLLAGNDTIKSFVTILKQDCDADLDVSITVGRIKACLPGSSPPPSIKVQTSEKKQETVPSDPQEGPIFLLCDDDQNILDILSEYLHEEGYQTISATRATIALEIFREQHVDIIFTDLKMPEMNGIDFAKAIRKINKFIPIVFISGNTSREHFKEYLKLGVEHFIEKPFSAADLLAVAKSTLREKRLKDSMLAMSRLSFKVYVTIEKILACVPSKDINRSEKEYLDACMQQMSAATTNLLASERAAKEKILNK